ncbi:hypothetical protein Kpho02_04880 [Kitasatospora phosalacinea]|uniref:Uncharacterized protein n=1 Tax=Kitasatospora phosalacinea TaxID=2065 RepID=A0A9W6Q1E8_9ACTN|nr:hypothetical protein [Kitasatospora phosalacinea]GLW68189.1 hypothetical protein Kpho02_04880 [Kitasatospora phosalacinea]
MPKNGTAIYLRCYPEDHWEMLSHRRALEDLADRSGLARPILYLDNGTRSTECAPRLEHLLADIAAGWVDTVLIPGTWVFALCPETARATADRLRAAGAHLVEMASPRSRAVLQAV